jgi:hypothetical protein
MLPATKPPHAIRNRLPDAKLFRQRSKLANQSNGRTSSTILRIQKLAVKLKRVFEFIG